MSAPSSSGRGAAHALRRLLAAAAWLLAACTDAPTGARAEARVLVSASVAGTTILSMTATVTAADISSPLVFNLPIEAGVASGAVTLPAGSARTVTLRAFGRGGETHRGSATLDVQPGTNTGLTVTLTPLTGQLPVTARIASVVVVVSGVPTSVLAPGDTFRLAAVVKDADGAALPLRPRWGSSNVLRATVDSLGLVTVAGVGPVSVFAAAGGAAAEVALSVEGRWDDLELGVTSCGLQEGVAYCWGLATYGAFGDGKAPVTFANMLRSRPAAVSTTRRFVDISVQGDHACAVDTDGAVWCWGADEFGQLGVDTASVALCTNPDSSLQKRCSRLPVQVAGLPPVKRVAAGSIHTCALAASGGAVWCWGYYELLGRGTVPSGTTVDWHPVAVAGLSAADVSAGDYHTCARTAAGEAWCWGLNFAGQLGDGVGSDRLVPVRVTGGTFKSLRARASSTCGTSTTDEAYCWGSNAFGELGVGTFDRAVHASPERVLTAQRFRELRPGGNHTCGLTLSSGAYCWGRADLGRLGTASALSDCAGPTCVMTPVPVAGGITFSVLKASTVGTCGIATTGRAYCWGDNGLNEFGNGTTTPSTTPVPGALVGPTIDVLLSARPHP